MKEAPLAAGIAGTQNHVSGRPLTTDLASQASPSLMLTSIDRAKTQKSLIDLEY